MSKLETEKPRHLFTETYRCPGLTIEALCHEEAVKNYYDDADSSDRQIIIQELIISNSQKTFNLTELLPSGWKFVDAGRTVESHVKGPRANRREKIVYLPLTPSVYYGPRSEYHYPGIEVSGMRLGSLHEIGHAVRYDCMADDEYKRLVNAAFLKNTALQRDLTSAETDEYLKIYIADERNAWTKAFRIYRSLLNHGINIEPDMTTKEAVKFARGFLQTFELEKLYQIRCKKPA